MTDSLQEKLPWVEKYRPSTVEDMVAHEEIVKTMLTFVNKNALPHLLFHGPPGTGKTSLILACARQLFGKFVKQMTLELNASDSRGIDVVRNEIHDFVSARSLFQSGNQLKLVILDEADHMTSSAQFALRRMIEQYSNNARFCLICNYASNIIPALQSRCTKFRFGPLSHSQAIGRLRYVVQKEGLTLTEDGENVLLKYAEGDMRKILNTLQSTALSLSDGAESPPTISGKAIHLSTATPCDQDVDTIFNALMNLSFEMAFKTITDICKLNGFAMNDIVRALHDRVVNLALPFEEARVKIQVALADAEYRLGRGGSGKIQAMGLVGAFQLARRNVA